MKNKLLLGSVLVSVIAGITGCSSQQSNLMVTPYVSIKHESVNVLTSNKAEQLRNSWKEDVNEKSHSITRETQVAMAIVDAVDDDIEPILAHQPINKTVYFQFSRDKVRTSFDDMLKKNATYLKQNLASRLLVVGFTDEKGSVDYNYDLGQRRADNVCKELVKLGVRTVQLTCESYGETHPADSAHTNEARTRNRRALLVY